MTKRLWEITSGEKVALPSDVELADNTASNVWTWSWIYKEKVWKDLRFKKIKAWSNITLNELEDEVEIESEQDVSELALKTNVLELNNTTAFTPDDDYEPATKKYVDDNSWGSSSPLTTKWDIYWYSTNDARLPVWTNWQVLSADSAEALWIKWIDSWANSEHLLLTFTADSNITAWDVCILKNNWHITKYTSAEDVENFIWFADETVTSGNFVKIVTLWKNNKQSWLTINQKYYLKSSNISNFSYDSSFDVSPQDTWPIWVTFNTDWTKMFIAWRDTKSIYEYHLTTWFDITTASYDSSFDASSQDTGLSWITFNTDGTKMFIAWSVTNSVYEYHLITWFDISTASYDSSFSVNSQDTDPYWVTFNTDWTKMFITWRDTKSIYEYHLTTGFDITTASYDSSFDISSQDTDPFWISFNTDGTKMHICWRDTNSVYEYHLITWFDISTASYDNSLDISSQDTIASWVTFNTDGTKMFTYWSEHSSVYEYHLNSGNWLSTSWDKFVWRWIASDTILVK